MEEEIKFFIKVWNNNLSRINEVNSYQELIQHCFKLVETNFGSIGKEAFTLKLNIEKHKYKEVIEELSSFIYALNYVYHENNFNNDSQNRKFIYQGQVNNGLELVLDRELIIQNGKIEKKSVTQKDLDYYIPLAIYRRHDKNEFNSFLNFNNLFEFVFYQLSLYNNSISRIRVWEKNLKQLILKEGDSRNLEDLKILAEIRIFFKDYNEIQDEYSRTQCWLNKVLDNWDFKYFELHFKRKDYTIFGENIIGFFKESHLDKLRNDYDKRKAKTIDEQSFIKEEIKTLTAKLNKENPRWSWIREEKGYKEVYDELIKGRREQFYEVDKAINAGEAEAIKQFIDFLEGIQIEKTTIRSIKTSTLNKIDLLPIELFDGTRGYLKRNALQVNICYKYKAYDGCSVLLRKITEILIIELFEKEGLDSKIRDDEGNFFMLKKLITAFQNEPKFNKIKSRNLKESLPRIKKYGDLSAHTRKFNARKDDVDRMREEYRIVFEELVYSIYH